MSLKRLFSIIIAILILLAFFPAKVNANSAMPPSLTVMVINPPDDLEISLQVAGAENHFEKAVVYKQAWESFFKFYPISSQGYEPININGATLIVTSSEKNFKISLPELEEYSAFVTLDFVKETLKIGAPAWRGPVLVSARVILTLVLEGLVFYLVGYRQKRSWVVFLAINLITQITLNALISGPQIYGYALYFFFLLESLIFIIEAIAFPLLLKEGSTWKAVWFSLLANFVSLVVGGWILINLPV